MEDISNTINKKTQYNLKIHTPESVLLDSTVVESAKKYGIHFTPSSKDADFYLFLAGTQYHLKDKDEVISIISSIERILNILFHLSKPKQTTSNDPKLDLLDGYKSNQRIRKAREKFSDQTIYLKHLNQKLYDSNELIDFAKSLFTLKPLKKFQTLHFFIHEKGQGNVSHLEISREEQRVYNHLTTEFNSLYQSIKKSKNRSFGHSNLKGFNFEIIGTFLAHEFSLSNHNIIFIVSRNDFLPQTKEEVSFFNFLAKNLSSYIEILLKKKLISNKIAVLENALHESPFEIQIDSNANPNLKSLSFDVHHLSNGNTLKIAPLYKDLINQADIFHHERVSLLGELLNTLRHELSNPIFGLQLTTELLLMEVDDKDSHELLKEILTSTKRSQNIIENFTKLYKGTEEYEEVDLIQLINEVYTLTKSESRHVNKKIESDLTSLKIYTNSTCLAQIFFNLVINSSQAMKGHASQAAEFITKVTQSENHIEFDIKDNGPGIPKEKITEIFKAFYTTKAQGTGLGLSIAKSLTTKLKGSLEALPDDKGAHFKLILPYENTCH